MSNTNPNLAFRLQRFQDLAYDKTKGRLWPKIENVFPLTAYTPSQQQIFIPLIKNTQNNRYLSRSLPPQSPLSIPPKTTLKREPLTKIKGPTQPFAALSPATPKAKDLTEQIQLYQQKIEELKQKNKALQQKTQHLAQKTQFVRQDLKSSTHQHQKHQTFLQQKEDRVKKMRQNLQKTRSAFKHLKRELREKQAELSMIRQNSIDQHAQLAIVRNEKKASEAMIKNLKAALTNLQQETATTPSQIEKLKGKLIQKEKELQEKNRQLTQLETKLQSENQLAQQMQALKVQIEKLTQNKQALKNALTHEKNQLDILKNKSSQLIRHAQKQAAIIQAQEQALEKLAGEKLKLTTFIDELAKKLGQAKDSKRVQEIIDRELPQNKITQTKPAQKTPLKKIKPPKGPSRLPQITNLPNAISGIVKDESGNPLPDAVIIIKGVDNKTLRAVKTNELGQFAVTTSMNNGTYIVEVHKEGLEFDILEVELKGGKLPPIEIRAHGKSV